MKKNVQNKIVLIFFIVGILIIVAISAFSLYTLQKMSSVTDVSNQFRELLTISIITIVLYIVITLVIKYFVSKSVVKPINRLIESAEKMASGQNMEISNILNEKTEVDELVNAFNLMTRELNQKLTEVNRQKKQIETILLHMTDGVIAFDMNGRIIHINTAAKNLLGVTEKEDTFEKMFRKLKIDVNLEKIIYLENWTSSEQKVEVGDKAVNLFFAPFQDENDKPTGVMVVIQDITEHVKLDNMRREFVADVSHELKTPITSIMGYADTLLEEEYDKETQNKFLGVIASEARRMAKLVTDLLTLSRYDNNKIKREVSQFDLGDLTKGCQEKLKFEIEKKHHNVECFVTANVPPVQADKDGIERVILNILSNAIKYTPENGTIKVYVGFVYNDAYIKIIDNGMGIPEKDLSRIFERFYRVDKARSRELGGTGLGLSIAQEILTKNNGSIDIKSEVGKGTEVVIRIPVIKH